MDGRQEHVIDLPCDVTLEATDDLCLRFALPEAPRHVVAGGLVPAQPDNHDTVQGGVGLAVPTAVEPVSLLFAAAGVEGRGAADAPPYRAGQTTVSVTSMLPRVALE